MSKIKAIISDSDGTLVNTLYMIRHGQYEAAVEYMLARGIPRHDIPKYEIYESYINMSVGGSTHDTITRTLKLLFEKTNNQHLEKIDFKEIDDSLQPIQDRIAPLYIHPFHGLTELFSWLGKNYIGMGIFTSGTAYHMVRHYGIALPVLGYTELYRNSETTDNYEKLHAFIARVKAVYGLSKFDIVTVDDVARAKPDPEGILKVMDKLEVTPDEVIVMGDHPYDMQAALAAGAHAIGTTHGFSTAAQLKAAGAIRTVENLTSIPALIQAHNSSKSRLF